VKKKAAVKRSRAPRLSVELKTEEERNVVRAVKARAVLSGTIFHDYVLELLRRDLKEQ
jgi:hypothetical protein